MPYEYDFSLVSFPIYALTLTQRLCKLGHRNNNKISGDPHEIHQFENSHQPCCRQLCL
jgi:hypothetical protein